MLTDSHAVLADYVNRHFTELGNVVDYSPEVDRLYRFDLTSNNKELNPEVFSDTRSFSKWIEQKLVENNCLYGIGGYMEHRTVYSRSSHFDTGDEPRRLHLGLDIWGQAGTPVYAPLSGTIHSFKDNSNFGDYGPTVIIEHNLDGLLLYSLYGHLSRENLKGLLVGTPIDVNQRIAIFGDSHENGNWPSHLHFQLMFDMQGKQGDYPGVCRNSEKEIYQQNIPDPQLILKFGKAINQ